MPDSDSDDSFHSLHETPNTSNPPKEQQQQPEPDKFPPEEEASLLASSNDLKTSGNAHFTSASYTTAIQTYDRALAQCPNYLDYELAVLRSNIAACHLMLGEWRAAVESAEKGLEGLERMEPLPRPKVQSGDGKGRGGGKDGEVEEGEGDGIVQEVTDAEETRITTSSSNHSLDKIRKLQTKLLLRRAKASTNLSTWTSLQSADEDYKLLLSPPMTPFLTPTDKSTISQSARALAPKLNAAKEKEMAEMMGKLKGLGNSLLKPFGLSTENFKFEEQEGGGYAMNFDQNGGKKN